MWHPILRYVRLLRPHQGLRVLHSLATLTACSAASKVELKHTTLFTLFRQCRLVPWEPSLLASGTEACGLGPPGLLSSREAAPASDVLWPRHLSLLLTGPMNCDNGCYDSHVND